MNKEFQLIFQGPDSIIILEKQPFSFAEKIAVRIMAHLHPSICEWTTSGPWLLPLNGRRFRLGESLYEIRSSEGVVGFPERFAQMAVAILVK